MIKYKDRLTRHEFIAHNFKNYLKGNIINVGGGGNKHLLEFVNLDNYVELDIVGNPDIKINLDKIYPLPIDPDLYDTVICTEVLEHLEEFHRVFSELLRISNKYVIISVPNALLSYRNYFLRRKYTGTSGVAGENVGMFKKYYGLPVSKPIDRHRWFFSYSEAEHFFNFNQILGYRIVYQDAVGKHSSSLLGRLIRGVLSRIIGKNLYKDLFYSAYWCVLEKINE